MTQIPLTRLNVTIASIGVDTLNALFVANVNLIEYYKPSPGMFFWLSFCDLIHAILLL